MDQINVVYGGWYTFIRASSTRRCLKESTTRFNLWHRPMVAFQPAPRGSSASMATTYHQLYASEANRISTTDTCCTAGPLPL